MEKIPHVWGVNHLLIDGDGTIAVVESHPRRTRARCAEGRFAAVTNHYLSAEMDGWHLFVLMSPPQSPQ